MPSRAAKTAKCFFTLNLHQIFPALAPDPVSGQMRSRVLDWRHRAERTRDAIVPQGAANPTVRRGPAVRARAVRRKGPGGEKEHRGEVAWQTTGANQKAR